MQGVPALSVVLPALNEAAGIVAALQALEPMRRAGAEVIVVDGGSADRSAELAAALADQVLVAPRGRAERLIAQAMAAGSHWGRFDVRIEGKSAWLPLVAAMMNRRSRLTGIATGDQAMFVTREAFAAAGGFPDIPLMEDIELSRRLLQTGRPACLTARVTTSGRRWEAQGVWRTILRMWWLRLRFFFGADPRRLAVDYGYAPRES
jgi:glycosyltransferase involved in cell wall biosynthesis